MDDCRVFEDAVGNSHIKLIDEKATIVLICVQSVEGAYLPLTVNGEVRIRYSEDRSR